MLVIKPGTIELILLGITFVGLQFWWIRMTIRNGRTGEVDKWGQRSTTKEDSNIELTKKRLEQIFRS